VGQGVDRDHHGWEFNDRKEIDRTNRNSIVIGSGRVLPGSGSATRSLRLALRMLRGRALFTIHGQ